MSFVFDAIPAVLFGTAAQAAVPALMGSFEVATAAVPATAGLFGAGGVATGAGIVKGGLTAVSVGSGVAGAAGQRYAGEASANAAEYNAAVDLQRAQREREASGLEASQFVKQQRRQLATARTGRLASGVTMSGSPLLVDEDTINEIAFNEALIRSGGETRATRLEQSAALSKSRAQSERTASYYRAGASLLNPLGNLMGSFEGMRSDRALTFFN